MKKNYQKIEILGETVIQYEDNDIVVTIPNDPANSDYQTYLRWLENPNADNGTISQNYVSAESPRCSYERDRL